MAAAGRPKPGEYNPQNTTVEMFSAIEAGDIAVTLIPKDSTQARIMIANKTNKPLNVKLPAAFAGVPVLARRPPSRVRPAAVLPNRTSSRAAAWAAA